MHFEFMHDHFLKRLVDLESKLGYDTTYRCCRDIIEEKLRLFMLCRNKWPMHALIDEDIKFRKEISNLHFSKNLR